jgi:hypothetical protein
MMLIQKIIKSADLLTLPLQTFEKFMILTGTDLDIELKHAYRRQLYQTQSPLTVHLKCLHGSG